jgi:hypothetical protein
MCGADLQVGWTGVVPSGRRSARGDVTIASDVRVALPRVLFTAPYVRSDAWASCDAMPDGRAFVLLERVQNWFEEFSPAAR